MISLLLALFAVQSGRLHTACALQTENQRNGSLNQKTKNELRERWKLRDPEGFAAQELRRTNYFEMKRKGKIPKA